MATQTVYRGTTTFGAAAAGDSFYVLDGSQNITGNVDYSGQNTSVLAEIARGFAGNIGTAADPWQTAFSTRLVYAGAGNLYFEGDAADTDTTALIQAIGPGTFHFLNQGIATRFEAISGSQVISNGVTITTGRFAGTSNFRLLDTGTGAAVVTLDVIGGNGYCQRPVTTINLMGGTLTLDADSAGGVNAHTTINVYGGVLNVVDAGTITTLNWYAGMVNTARLTRPLTITNTNINMMLMGAQALLDNTALITFTNTPTRLMTDGRPL